MATAPLHSSKQNQERLGVETLIPTQSLGRNTCTLLDDQQCHGSLVFLSKRMGTLFSSPSVSEILIGIDFDSKVILS